MKRAIVGPPTVEAGASWGTYGRGQRNRFTLECGHAEREPFSRGVPKSGMLDCSTCHLLQLRCKLHDDGCPCAQCVEARKLGLC